MGQLIGGLLITYLLSRLAMRLLRSMKMGLPKLLAAHGATLAFCWIVYAFGAADGGSPKWNAGIIYVLSVLIWFTVDWLRDRRSDGADFITPEDDGLPSAVPKIIRRGNDS